MNAAEPSKQPAPAAAPAPTPNTVLPAPPALANALSDAMYAKTTKSPGQIFLLGLTGGAFIALGFIYFITSQQGAPGDLPLGLTKIIGGVVFSCGLFLVLVSGSDLFTGSTMTVMPALQGRLKGGPFAIHWVMSLLGNLVGSVADRKSVV